MKTSSPFVPKLPLLLWGTGYFHAMCSLVFFPSPRESFGPWSLVAAFLLLGYALLRDRTWIANAVRGGVASFRFLPAPIWWPAFLLLGGLFLLSGIASLYPPHLPQEYDAFHYHMGLLRQHLLAGNFRAIPWSTADLFPMALQTGLAPYWFYSAEVFNKVPQWILAWSCFPWMVALSRERGARGLQSLLPALFFFSAHGVMIQLGTAMLDLANLSWLLGAAWFLMRRNWAFAGISLAIFGASKSFHFPLLAASAFLVWVLLRWNGSRLWKRREVIALLVSCGLAGGLFLARSILMSMETAGTPLFPFAACALGCAPPEHESAVRASAQALLRAKDDYGHGRGPVAFVRHLWEVSVPTRGVNNDFDYPLGLPWLLFILGAATLLLQGRRALGDPFLAAALTFWALWWMGSQQSRWLYAVLAFGFIGLLPFLNQVRSSVWAFAVSLSLALSLASSYRAISPTLQQTRADIVSQMRSEVRWNEKGDALITLPLLYVDRPVLSHANDQATWVFQEALNPTK